MMGALWALESLWWIHWGIVVTGKVVANWAHMGVSINGGTPKWLVHNGQSQSNMDDNWGYPLVNIQKAIEHGHRNS